MKGLIDMSKAFPIKDFPGYYVTDTGDVYSRNYGIFGRFRKLKQESCKNGYKRVTLCVNGKTSRKLVHRLVAEVFIPNPEKKCDVNHINGVRDDNNVNNLEWMTRAENIKHAYEALGNTGPMSGRHGKDNPHSKIVQQIKNGKVVAEFYGCVEAEQYTGIHRSGISDCCRGYKHSKSAGGYQWKYK